MTATLTDRYIWAVQRSLPEAQRADIDRELRGTIADAVDAKIEDGRAPIPLSARRSPTWATLTGCLLYTSPSPRDGLLSRMPSSA